MRSLEPVEEPFLREAPVTITSHNFLAAPRTAVFACISGDPAGWGDWFPGFSHNGRWETPEPQGVGSVRTVDAYRSAYRETILAWERDARWAFRVDETTSPLFEAFAEDYRVTDAGTGTLLSWTAAFRPARAMRLAMPVAPATFRMMARRMAARLAPVAVRSSG
ncbi:MAG TPA: SRPBCC family protein [Frankiaceae bacterium]|jgi:hypothetical protein|nr:SRPBCC family protein [Frankiaceae bacterium]